MSRFFRFTPVLSTLVLALCAFSQFTFAQTAATGQRPELALQLGHSGFITSLKHSPDGTLLASGSNDNTVKIWDAATRELIFTLEGHGAPVWGVAFSTDGSTLATGDEYGDIKLWNPQTGVLKKSLPRLLVGVKKLEYSRDGKYLAAAAGIRGTGPTRDERGQWVLWDAQTLKVLRSVISPTAYLSLAFAPDTSTVALGNADKTVTIIEPASGITRASLPKFKNFPNALEFAPNGSILAATDGNAIQLWSVAEGATIRRLTRPDASQIFSIVFSPDSQTLSASTSGTRGKRPTGRKGVLVSNDFTICSWNVADGNLRKTVPTAITYALSYSTDGTVLVTGASGELRLFSLIGELLHKNDALAARRRWIRSVAWSRDGKLFASSGGSDGHILLWDAQSGALRRTMRGQKSQVLAIEFAPDGTTLATASDYQDSVHEDGVEITLWNALSGQVLRRWRSHTSSVHALTFSPDGKFIATGGENKVTEETPQTEEINLWNAASGAHIKTWRGRPGWVASLAFSPDGKRIASVQSGAKWRPNQPGEYAVTVREVASDRVLFTMTGHTDNISGVAWSRDGKWIASASKDKTVRVWDAQTGKLAKSFAGHADWVRSVAWSPDGKTLVSAGQDNTVRQWSFASGKVQRVFNGHEGDVMDARFAPDGKTIASGGLDTTVRIWDAAAGREIVALLTAPGEKQTGLPATEIEPLWLAAMPEGYYNCAEGADYIIKWRFGGKLLPFYHFEESYRRPDFLKRALRGEHIVARPLLLTRVPPAIRIIAPLHGGEIAGNTVRVLVEAADDSTLGHSNFAFYVNGTLVPDDIAKPITVDGKPIVVDGKPITVDGKPITVDGKPIVVDGKPITVDGKPITVDGKPITVDGKPIMADGKPITADGRAVERATETSTQTGVGGTDAMARYAFHRLYVLDVPLPREEKIVLRAIVSDNEANKSDDAVVLRRLDKEPVKGNLYLVSIGVSKYRNPMYNINYAAADARSISDALLTQQGANYARVESKVLSDEKATAKNIRAALSTLKSAGPDDTVMVFLSGHGVQTGGKTYFAPWGIFVNDVEGTCMEWREILETLSLSYARKLLFTDACHSGAKLGNRQATGAQMAEAVRREAGIVMFSSSQGDEFSFENKEVKQGEFSVALAEAFAGKADVDGDGNITLPEIAMYVPKRVSEATKGLQNPQLVLVQDFNPQAVLAKVGKAGSQEKLQAVAIKTSTP